MEVVYRLARTHDRSMSRQPDIEVQRLKRVQSCGPFINVAVAHIGEERQHHVAGEYDLLIGQENQHITAGMSASKMAQLYFAIAVFEALKERHLLFEGYIGRSRNDFFDRFHVVSLHFCLLQKALAALATARVCGLTLETAHGGRHGV